ENYVLLLVLLSVFAGGTLVLLSLLLLFCHRCCLGGRRYSRASDDPEKTNTTYAEDSQPTQEITIRLDESDALSASSCHDGESDRFVSTGSTGRRVSFNESALYDQEKNTQEKGRSKLGYSSPLWRTEIRRLCLDLRYTLTEGDFHHLKKARLTHLHLPPAPCDLKILTIMECDSTESSTINISETSAPNLPLSIYQPAERGVPDWLGQSLSGGLPGDPHHSTVLDQRDLQSSSVLKSQRSQTMEAIGDRGEAESEWGPRGEPAQAPGPTSVLHFLSKLRRHASLEGAGPYFRRWKFDTSHRAASLDAKGSPKRKPFQRQRAASETTDHTDEDSSPLKLEAMVEVGGSATTSSSRRAELCFPSDPALGQVEPAVNGTGAEQETVFGAAIRTKATRNESESAEDDEIRQESSEAPPSLYRDIWSLRASLEQYASSDQSSTDRESVRSDADSVSSFGGARSGLDTCLSQDLDDEPEGDDRKLLQMDSGYASIEAPSRAPEVSPTPQPPSPHRSRLRRRDYSIDEKTDALFNEFLRHDPRFDQQDSPLRSRHRSRVHLRKQWQRHKQYSDPGSASGGRYSPSLERQRFTPLRRGDSAGYPLDTR
uniref:CACN subunit beta associated regulatory protein b n=1 Tax=Poecilia formosa TaxID=48698 RepID=A0A096MFP0_POEFO